VSAVRAAGFGTTLWLASLGPACAHVKWFCAYNVAEIPQPLSRLLDSDFLTLVGVSLAIFCIAGIIDSLFLGRAMIWSLDLVTGVIRPSVPAILRATMGGFLVALWSIGGIILTPELKTGVQAISWLQLLFAACLIWERGLVLTAYGIVALYAYGIEQYGVFHMLDYPVFLGAALYFAMMGLRARPWRLEPLDVLRYAAAITLLWASVEKWAYPQWTYPLFVLHPEMGMGFSAPFYMKAAGVVEFSLAFALLGTPLMRRTAAIVLASMFTAAVLEFGKVDAVGHSPIIAVMIAIAADNRPGRRQSPLLAPAGYVVALVGIVSAYYGLHALLF
jgi:hypothetical protein